MNSFIRPGEFQVIVELCAVKWSDQGIRNMYRWYHTHLVKLSSAKLWVMFMSLDDEVF